MIGFLSLIAQKNEQAQLERELRLAAAKWTEEEWKYYLYTRIPEVIHFLRDLPTLDLMSWDLTVPDSIKELELVRESYREIPLMLIADAAIPPTSYIRPAIMPSALLLKPFDEREMTEVINELVGDYIRKYYQSDQDQFFLIETREGAQRVAYNRVWYFEARDKKVYLRTKAEEFGFYETIDDLMQNLPEHFRRCHRSYIVNMEKAVRFNAADSLLEMESGIAVPVSRSYRKSIKSGI